MHTGCSCKSYLLLGFMLRILIISEQLLYLLYRVLLVLPLSSNIVDFILPGWCQIYIATAQNWPATWQTRPTETSVIVVHCTCTPCFKFCTPTFKILPNTLTPDDGKSPGRRRKLSSYDLWFYCHNDVCKYHCK